MTEPKQKTPRPFTSWQAALPPYGVVNVQGAQGEGKSCLVWALVTDRHEKGRKVAALGIPRKGRRFFPKWVRHINDVSEIQKLKDYDVVVDEAALQANARKHATEANILLSKLDAISRQNGQLLFFLSQNSRQSEVSTVWNSALLVFKLPTLLHIRFARPELRPEVERAREVLLAKKHSREWAFVKEYKFGREGVLRNALPAWWTENASNVFALTDFEDKDVAPKKPRQHKGQGPVVAREGSAA